MRFPPTEAGQNRMPRVVAPIYGKRPLRRNASARCVLLSILMTQDEQMSRVTRRILGLDVASVEGSRVQPPPGSRNPTLKEEYEMRGSKVLVMVLALVTFAVGPTVALAASQPSWNSGKSGMLDYRSTEGRVAAVDLTAKTIQVMPTDGSMPGPVRVAIGDQTVIRQGILHRTLADLKVGEDVTLRYSGSANTWVADNINVLDSSVSVAQYLGSR